MKKAKRKRRVSTKPPRPIYIREWRHRANLSVERLALRVDSTGATISRLERGLQPYTQPLLEAIADALGCSPADLIMRPPGTADELAAIWGGLSPESQKRAIAVVKAIKDSDDKAA